MYIGKELVIAVMLYVQLLFIIVIIIIKGP